MTVFVCKIISKRKITNKAKNKNAIININLMIHCAQ